MARMLRTRLGLPLEPAISPDDELSVKAATPAATRLRNDLDTAEDEREEEGDSELDNDDQEAGLSMS